MNINDDEKQYRKRKSRSKCYRSKKVKGFKCVLAHVKYAEKSVNSTVVETDVNGALVDFDLAANSVQYSDENLVNNQVFGILFQRI